MACLRPVRTTGRRPCCLPSSYSRQRRSQLRLEAHPLLPTSHVSLTTTTKPYELVQRWESILQYVGDPTGKFGPRAYDPEKRLERALKALGLVGTREQSRKGLHFVLADTATQLWTLLLGSIGGGTGEKSSVKKTKEAPAARDVADQLEILCQLVTTQG